MERNPDMKRFPLFIAGLLSLSAAGCCCDWCNCCQPRCNPCGNACGPTYTAPMGTYSAPSGAYYSPYGAPATAALMPVESLPTY
jgi:hypothetical protein